MTHLGAALLLCVGLCLASCGRKPEQQVAGYLYEPFVHPGMFQGQEDLEFVKARIQAGDEPWLSAFERLKAETDTSHVPQACSYVSVGAYGADSRGGKEFSADSKYAYACAWLWCVTGERVYAEQAIRTLNAWSGKLWGLDGNNAKLNVGLFGQYYLNAAELLRCTDAGWRQEDVEQFERMLRTVYYPTIRDFFTEANGNWDASMICTMMCMGVFLEDHDMFNRAVERFYRGNGNGGITRYIYPGGQCQETTRDWDHVQLGLGELSRAAQVAWTQGLDFYSVADDRMAQGFEYAARFLSGVKVSAWGDISSREKDEVRDIYHSLYNHYVRVKGMELPYTRQMRDRWMDSTSLSMLSAARLSDGQPLSPSRHKLQTACLVKPSQIGALPVGGEVRERAIVLKPGDDIQRALDLAAGRWVMLGEGVHVLREPLRLPSGARLAGEGRLSVLMLAPDCTGPTVINRDSNMSDVIIRSLLIEGATKPGTGFDPNYERSGRLYGNAPSREGVVFLSDSPGCMKDIRLENLTIQNFTKNGAVISGASDVLVSRCDFDNNGSAVVPGPHFHHNLRLAHVQGAEVSDSRFDSSLWGHGVEVSCSSCVSVVRNELARNALCGIYCADTQKVLIEANWIEGNDASGIKLDRLMDGCFDVQVSCNKIQYNDGYAVEWSGDDEPVVATDNVIVHNLYE